VLELWTEDTAARLVHRYPVLAASGALGPKLRQGDLQVPEGVYRVLWLNPNSSYHLSMKLDYPNAFDREHARRDRRTDLGGDIFVHGRAVSIGCVALGDPAIEELFVLAADTGGCRAYGTPRSPPPGRPSSTAWSGASWPACAPTDPVTSGTLERLSSWRRCPAARRVDRDASFRRPRPRRVARRRLRRRTG
jgi:hypothetical protein